MFLVSDRLDFNTDGRDWPHRDHSRFVEAASLKWHVQEMGEGNETLVLIHGTGASAHSWRALMPLLASRYRVVAFDLPGQGFTTAFRLENPTIENMDEAVSELLLKLGVQSPILIGHSAGAAIALKLALSGKVHPRAIISINGALYPFPGAGSAIFPMMARLLFLNPVVPHVFAMGAAGKHRVERLLRGTGSQLDDRGLELYQRLFKNPGHVRATLSWMANWDLEPLVRRMGQIDVPFLQLIGTEDETISPSNAHLTEERIKSAKTVRLKGYGHLVHEEEPKLVAAEITSFVQALMAETAN